MLNPKTLNLIDIDDIGKLIHGYKMLGHSKKFNKLKKIEDNKMDKESMLNNVYLESFGNELEKIGVSIEGNQQI